MASKKQRAVGIVVAILMIVSILIFALMPLMTATNMNYY